MIKWYRANMAYSTARYRPIVPQAQLAKCRPEIRVHISQLQSCHHNLTVHLNKHIEVI